MDYISFWTRHSLLNRDQLFPLHNEMKGRVFMPQEHINRYCASPGMMEVHDQKTKVVDFKRVLLGPHFRPFTAAMLKAICLPDMNFNERKRIMYTNKSSS